MDQYQNLFANSKILQSYLQIRQLSVNKYLYEKDYVKYVVEVLKQCDLIYYEKIKEITNYIIGIIQIEEHDNDNVIVIFEEHYDPLKIYNQKQKDYHSLQKLMNIVKYLDKQSIQYPYLSLDNIYCANQQYKLKLINLKDINQHSNIYQLGQIYLQLLSNSQIIVEKNDATQQQFGEQFKTQTLLTDQLKLLKVDENIQNLLNEVLLQLQGMNKKPIKIIQSQQYAPNANLQQNQNNQPKKPIQSIQILPKANLQQNQNNQPKIPIQIKVVQIAPNANLQQDPNRNISPFKRINRYKLFSVQPTYQQYNQKIQQQVEQKGEQCQMELKDNINSERAQPNIRPQMQGLLSPQMNKKGQYFDSKQK